MLGMIVCVVAWIQSQITGRWHLGVTSVQAKHIVTRAYLVILVIRVILAVGRREAPGNPPSFSSLRMINFGRRFDGVA